MKILHQSLCNFLDVCATDATWSLKKESDGHFTLVLKGEDGPLPVLKVSGITELQLRTLASSILLKV